MSEIELSYVWDHTITKILNYDIKSDIHTEDKTDSKSIQTSQVHHGLDISIPNEVDSHTVKHVPEIDPNKENGEQNNAKEDKHLTTNYKVIMENQKIEGFITYSMDEQIS